MMCKCIAKLRPLKTSIFWSLSLLQFIEHREIINKNIQTLETTLVQVASCNAPLSTLHEEQEVDM